MLMYIVLLSRTIIFIKNDYLLMPAAQNFLHSLNDQEVSLCVRKKQCERLNCLLYR